MVGYVAAELEFFPPELPEDGPFETHQHILLQVIVTIQTLGDSTRDRSHITSSMDLRDSASSLRPMLLNVNVAFGSG